MPEGGDETETTRVQTRIPKYQKEEWKAHADRLGVSQSEFVQLMVQAGRRGLEDIDIDGSDERPVEGNDPDPNPGGRALERRVQDVLREEGVMSWDELVDSLAGDFEKRLEDALDELRSASRVKYSGPDGGYVLTDDVE